MNGGRGQALLADVLERQQSSLVDLWERLEGDGPTLGSSDAGSRDDARARYLVPLSRVLIGALRGSRDHGAVYLDERRRYLPPGLVGGDAAAVLRTRLAVEIPAIAAMVAPRLPSDVAEELLWSIHSDLTHPPEPDLRILYLGDCRFVETRAFLTSLARERGRSIDVRQAFFSARQPLEERNSAIVSAVQNYRPDIVGISLYTFEGIPPYTAAWARVARPTLTKAPAGLASGLVRVLHEVVDDIRSISDFTLVVHTPGGVPVDRYRNRLTWLSAHSRGQRRLLGEIAQGTTELVDGTPNTILLDEMQVIGANGGARSVGAPAFRPKDVPDGYFHATRLGPLLAAEYESVAADWLLLGKAKAVFVDFDNTLWSGVMADGPVRHDLEGQRLLKQLRNAGVLLVALSKNDPRSIRWDEMILKEDDFAVLKINWQPKPDNVAAAIHELDLAPSAFVLLDDNPVERALVCENVAGVKSADPADARTWRALRRWLAFPSTTQTEEAKRRTVMYREAAARKASVDSSLDYPSMMASLGLVYHFRPARRGDMSRLMELVQRTNQFNTTTRRRTAAEVEVLLKDEDIGVYVASLKDRFGDLGVVALAVFRRSTHTFDSVIMSCRAMGFGLEIALVTRVLKHEMSGDVVGEFVATDRNAPASDLFRGCGFTDLGGGQWVLPTDAPRPTVPAWFS